MQNLSLYCPPMKIEAVGFGTKRTVAEPMTATITKPDGSTLIIENVVIPPTDVKRKGFLSWEVDACQGSGGNADASIVVFLPVEPVNWSFWPPGIVARKIDCKGKLVLDGVTYSLTCTFPDCRLSLGSMTATAVTATGEIYF